MGSLLDELRIERRGESAPGAQSRRRRAWTRKTALAGAGLAIVAGTASAYFVSARPLAVNVFTVTGSVSASPTPPATLLTAGGYVRDARVVYVAPKVAGRIVSLSVREGDQVQAGVQIAALDSRDLAQEAAEARATSDPAFMSNHLGGAEEMTAGGGRRWRPAAVSASNTGREILANGPIQA